MALGLTCIAASTTFWGDEVWGPRYIVPTAWALLVPIAWWADTALRRKVLVGVATLGVAVQIVGVSPHIPLREAWMPSPESPSTRIASASPARRSPTATTQPAGSPSSRR